MKFLKSIRIIGICMCFTACSKYLSQKPDDSLVVPSSVADLTALMDNYQLVNVGNVLIGEAASDNYYLSVSDWKNLSPAYQNNYIWEDEITYNTYPNAWSVIYQNAYTCNVVLDKIEKIERNKENATSWDNVKGMALFHRSFAFFRASINWALPYDSLTASSKPGIPLRLTTDFNEKYSRPTLSDCFERIIADTKSSLLYLPDLPTHVLRPSKCAAYAFLSRIYLYMGNYTLSKQYADSSLAIKDDLIDYNKIDDSKQYSFDRFSDEVIFDAEGTAPPLNTSYAKIDSTLINSYGVNDIRKTIFYTKNADGSSFSYKGSYANASLFIGFAVDEIYLNRAECSTRSGHPESALKDLNLLLAKRWKTGSYAPYTTMDKTELLRMIANERRKELPMRDLRWMDLKRYNIDGAGIGMVRNLDGKIYSLLPNSVGYALHIPLYVIQLSGIQQN